MAAGCSADTVHVRRVGLAGLESCENNSRIYRDMVFLDVVVLLTGFFVVRFILLHVVLRMFQRKAPLRHIGRAHHDTTPDH